MSRSLLLPILGTLAAIAITTAMDATGYTSLSALPLFPLMALFSYLQRLSRREVGLVWGPPRHYRQALLQPLLVIGAATLAAVIGGAVSFAEADWGNFWVNLIAGGLSAILLSVITEEGFFRGWLWASLKSVGCSERHTLIWTSLAFALWHVSPVTLATGYDLPAAQIPVYLGNVVLLGLVWGMLRLVSGSVIVASVAHGVWNGLAYALFAFGTKVGALGVTETWIYGPEVGYIGLALNALYAAVLWLWIKGRQTV